MVFYEILFNSHKTTYMLAYGDLDVEYGELAFLLLFGDGLRPKQRRKVDRIGKY